MKPLFIRIATITVCVLITIGQLSSSAQAATVTLAWDETIDDSVVAYHIFSRIDGESYNYSQPSWSGADSSCVIENLDPDTTYFFVARAVNRYNVESDNSNEVSFHTPVTPEESNPPPVADAGANRIAFSGEVVWLDGSGSSDDTRIASHFWKQISGPSVDLQNNETEIAFFTTPDSLQDDFSLVFELIVTDEYGLQAKDLVIVNIRQEYNAEPPFELGRPVAQAASEGTTIILEIPPAVDPSIVASVCWEQTGGPPVTLSDPTSESPSFLPPPVTVEGTTLTFRLTIESSDGFKDSLDYTIQVADNNVCTISDTAIPIVTYDGRSLEIEAIDGATLTRLASINPESIEAGLDPPGTIFCGLLDMELMVENPGDSATLLITYHEPLPSNCGWFKYNSESGWYNYSDYIQTDYETNQIRLTLTDGGPGDDDGTADGVIVDPSGLVFNYPSGASSFHQNSSETADPGGNGGCFLRSASTESCLPSCITLLTLFAIFSGFLGLCGDPARSFTDGKHNGH